MAPKQVNFTPPGAVAQAFMLDDSFVRGIKGPIGSGKSVACVMELWRRAMEQQPGPDGMARTRFAIVRNTYAELKTTTVKTFFDWIPKAEGHWKAEGPPTFTYKSNSHEAEFLFLALDRDEDVRKLLSLELTGVWFNEARYLSKAVLDASTGRVARFPPKRDGGPTWTGVIMDTNPPDTESWWYKFAEEDPQEGWTFFSQPSGLSDEAENIDNLTDGYNYYHRQIPGKDPDWIKVYVHGEYGFLMEGKPIFPQYKDSVHSADIIPNPNIPIVCGIDFGLTPAAVFMQQLPTGQWTMVHEIVTEDMGAERLAGVIKQDLTQRFPQYEVEFWGDPAGVQRSQTDEKTTFEALRLLGVPVRSAPSNNLAERLNAVRAPLDRMVDGKPGLLVDKKCTFTRKAFAGGYCYRKLKISSARDRYNEKPDKNEHSHVMDALQYALLSAGEGIQALRSKHRSRPRQTEAQSGYNELNHGVM